MQGHTFVKAAAIAAAALLSAGVPFMSVSATEDTDTDVQDSRDAADEATKKEKATGEKGTHQYIIAQDGTGDFTTIQEGVDNAADGDTLIVCPGTYIETVEVMGKELHIEGVSRDQCILMYDTAFYRKVPLTIAAGSVSNMTIYGINSGIEQEAPTDEEIAQINESLIGDSWERQKNYSGYAVHIDQNILYNRSMRFENCRILSENSHCLGIGARGGSTISFEGCELVSLSGGGCIYLHDSAISEQSGEVRFSIKNSEMTCYMCPYVMAFQSFLPDRNTTYLTFQNVRVSAVAYAMSSSYVPFNVNTSFDVESLMALEKTGALYWTGLSSTAPELVHALSHEDTVSYMTELEKGLSAGNAAQMKAVSLAEGITYIGANELDAQSSWNSLFPVKHQTIAIYNADNQPGDGWCGLDSAYLTEDSFGNTLVEMNAVHIAAP